MDAERQLPYFTWVSAINEIGIKTYRKLQTVYDSPRSFYEAGINSWEESGIFTKAQLKKILLSYENIKPCNYFEKMVKDGIRIIPYESDEFPEKLKEISTPPVSLFLKGKLPPQNSVCVSVIGTRECSFYGAEVAGLLGQALACRDISLISGMARGIDSLSQIATVNNGGYSLAVLGGGVDVIYPRESLALYRKLEYMGGIVSEYAPGVLPQSSFFALRNRLISGLSDAVCVVEAREKSGTMITVDAALEQGKDVYAIPGRITDRSSRGCHEIIRQGASIITDIDVFADEILQIYGDNFSFATKVNRDSSYINSDNNQSVCVDEMTKNILKFSCEDSFLVSELSVKLNCTAADLLLKLMKLTADGLFINMGAGRFRMGPQGIILKNNLIEKGAFK